MVMTTLGDSNGDYYDDDDDDDDDDNNNNNNTMTTLLRQSLQRLHDNGYLLRRRQ